MESSQQRINDLEDHLQKDYQLLKELEDKNRLEDDPRKKKYLESEIKRIEQSIKKYQTKLHSIKQENNQKFNLALEMTKVTYTELDMVTKGIMSMPISSEINFTLITPQEKIITNHLSNSTQHKLQIGLMKTSDVRKFIEHMTDLIPDFADKVKAGLINEYKKLKAQSLEGDILFDKLQNFACRDSQDFREQTAGLAVVSYFFEACDLFEK